MTLTNLKLGLGYLNVYSDCPQIPSKAINAKGLRVKNWNSLYCSTPEKKRNSILYLTYHFLDGKNALHIFLIFALTLRLLYETLRERSGSTMIFNCGSKSYLVSHLSYGK